jgi:hypothetical protein
MTIDFTGVTARVGDTEWTTSLFVKDGQYVVPVKTRVREAERLRVGDDVRVRLAVGVSRSRRRRTAARVGSDPDDLLPEGWLRWTKARARQRAR